MVRAAARADGYWVVVWRRTFTMSKGWPVGVLVEADVERTEI